MTNECLVNTPRKRDRGKHFPKISTKQTQKFQQKLEDYYLHHVNGIQQHETYLEAAGDPLIDKDDNLIRFLFQNINGLKLNDGFEVAPEITVLGALQADIAGYAEINSNANNKVQDRIRSHMQAHLGSRNKPPHHIFRQSYKRWISPRRCPAGSYRTSQWTHPPARK